MWVRLYVRLSKVFKVNVLITGASGFIGQNLIKLLLKSDHKITACIHINTLPFEIKVYQCDFTKMLKATDWLPLLMGIDVVINCVGVITENRKNSFEIMHVQAPIALFKACEKTNVKRVIQLSALGADESAITAYHKSKKRADDYLQNSSLEWFILRPSLVYGEGGKSFQFFKYLSNLPIIPLVGKGEQKIQPVKVETVVEVIVKCLDHNEPYQILNTVGDQALSYQQWMMQLRRKKSKVRFIKIPIGVVKFMATLLKPFGLKMISKDNLKMLQQNNVADYEPLKQFIENKS